MNFCFAFFFSFRLFQEEIVTLLQLLPPDKGVTLQRAKSYFISTVHWCITTYRLSNTEDLFFQVTV